VAHYPGIPFENAQEISVLGLSWALCKSDDMYRDVVSGFYCTYRNEDDCECLSIICVICIPFLYMKLKR
jgi:hypothetical protein